MILVPREVMVDAILPDVQAGKRVLNFAMGLLAALLFWKWTPIMEWKIVRRHAPVTVRRRVYLKIKLHGLPGTSIKENLYVIRLTTVLQKLLIAIYTQTQREELKVVDQEALGLITRNIFATREMGLGIFRAVQL